MNYTKGLFVSVVLISIFTTISLSAQAQENQRKFFGIIIEPAIVYLDVAPGQTVTGKINLTHDFQSKQEYTFYPNPVNFRQTGESGVPELYFDSTLDNSINPSAWISITEDKYTLNFQDRVDSNYTIKIPPNAQPGGHYAAVMYTEDETTNGEVVGLNKAIGALFFITVAGDVKQDGELLEFKSDKKVYDFTPVVFSIRYKNSGNVHRPVGGNIFIHKGDVTKPTAILEVNKQGELSLPRDVRQYFEIYSDGFITRKNNSWQLNWEKVTKIHFGKYYATLKLKHDRNNQRVTTEREISFWIVPWQLILLIVLIIFALITYATYRFGRKRNKRRR